MPADIIMTDRNYSGVMKIIGMVEEWDKHITDSKRRLGGKVT